MLLQKKLIMKAHVNEVVSNLDAATQKGQNHNAFKHSQIISTKVVASMSTEYVLVKWVTSIVEARV